MKIKLLSLVVLAAAFNQTANAEGYYVSGKFATGNQYASSMDTSLRIGINPSEARYVEVDSKDGTNRGAFAVGYKFDNLWQVEVEYNTKVDTDFVTSVAGGQFNGSSNNYQITSERVMVNAYRAIPVYSVFSVYGQAGLGLAKVDVGGWQGNETRRYDSNSQTNLAYSLGAGARADITTALFADIGYRYTGLGKVESGFNDFANRRGQRDEQMKADLTEQEVYFGLTYVF
ncbi:outer membrane protein [Aeromonas cavernicola]|uniref:Porin family protein n=1 Tax=Aeromonas cavernicola TaxID=1006623 RepID=A0A2H9U3J5_9GAMM|nr:outer membrane beta-barrel protein [Aeromonas cavernicola]PJG58627.1 porin family protein [Aeromonas cavernicola]